MGVASLAMKTDEEKKSVPISQGKDLPGYSGQCVNTNISMYSCPAIVCYPGYICVRHYLTTATLTYDAEGKNECITDVMRFTCRGHPLLPPRWRLVIVDGRASVENMTHCVPNFRACRLTVPLAHVRNLPSQSFLEVRAGAWLCD